MSYSVKTVSAFETGLKSLIKDYVRSICSDRYARNISEEFLEETSATVMELIMDPDASANDFDPFFDFDRGRDVPFLVRCIENITCSIIVGLLDHREYEQEHINDVLRFDKETTTMFFNETALPAYWYNKGMSEEKIEETLKEYRSYWADLGYKSNIRYPIIEILGKLDELKQENVGEQLLERMEKDLERLDTDEAIGLYHMMTDDQSIRWILEKYPDKLKDAVIKGYIGEGTVQWDIGLKFFLVDLILKDGEIVPVRLGINGRGIRSTTAIGERGFPRMTDADEAIILRRLDEWKENNQFENQ